MQKEEQAKLRKKQNEINKMESKIAELEETVAKCDDKLSNPANAFDAARLISLQKDRDEAALKLDILYEEWEKLNS